jgi:hypothetical protein
MTTQQEIEQFLIHAGFEPPRHPMARYHNGPFAWRENQTATHEDVAHNVLEIAESYGLRLGNWFGTTDGEIIMAAVRTVVPPIYRTEIALLVEGLKLAARIQQQQGRKDLAGPVAVGVLVAIGLLALAFRGPRKA